MTTTPTTEKPNQPAATEKAPPPEMPIGFGSGGLNLTSLPETHRFAQYIAQSAFCPKGMRAADVVVAIQFGAELGLGPVQAVQNIAVINGRPTLWGDALLALCRKSPLFEETGFAETFTGKEFDDSFRATTRVCRKGGAPTEYSYSVADAKRAGLWGRTSKQGEPMPWSTNPKRMLRYRARAFALRDAFPDVLKGLYSREEMLDAALHAVDLGDESDEDRTATVGAKVKKQVDALKNHAPAEAAEPAPVPEPDPALDQPMEPPFDPAPPRADIVERLSMLTESVRKKLLEDAGILNEATMGGVKNAVDKLTTVEDLTDLKMACAQAAAKAKTKKKDSVTA